MCLWGIQRQTKQKETSLFPKLGTGVKQRAFGDWHIQRVPCQSCAQSISSSQSVLFVCWICFGTCRPLIDMGAGAGKTLLWCEANNGPSVTLPQMFGLRGSTGTNGGTKIWTFSLLFSFSLLPFPFTHCKMIILICIFALEFIQCSSGASDCLLLLSALICCVSLSLCSASFISARHNWSSKSPRSCYNFGYKSILRVMIVTQEGSHRSHAPFRVEVHLILLWLLLFMRKSMKSYHLMMIATVM